MSPGAQDIKQMRIVAIDDNEVDLRLARTILELEGYERVETTTDAAAAAVACAEDRPDLVVLDLRMPKLDGFGFIERLDALTGRPRDVPILMLTGEIDDELRHRALRAGARDFLHKPVDRIDFLLRVHNLLEVQLLQNSLREYNAHLEQEVAIRTQDLERARREMLERLALAGEYRDDDTHQHAQRIGRSCARLAIALDRAPRDAELIGRAAPLHDIGKIGIPDAILLKPGTLTDEEFEIIKSHTTIGAGILGGSHSVLLHLAEVIALSHHERWDGQGYPGGLRGDEIPMTGRIVALADVFDALTHERPYKPAWPVADALAEIQAQAGRQFDPALVDAFLTLDHVELISDVG